MLQCACCERFLHLSVCLLCSGGLIRAMTMKWPCFHCPSLMVWELGQYRTGLWMAPPQWPLFMLHPLIYKLSYQRMRWRDPQHQHSWDAHLTHMYITLVAGVGVSTTSWYWCHAASYCIIHIIHIIIWWDVSHTGPREDTPGGENMSTEETNGEKRGKARVLRWSQPTVDWGHTEKIEVREQLYSHVNLYIHFTKMKKHWSAIASVVVQYIALIINLHSMH